MSQDYYESIKKEIIDRAKARANECVVTDEHPKVLRAQGAARELEQLLSVMERMENPEPPKEQAED